MTEFKLFLTLLLREVFIENLKNDQYTQILLSVVFIPRTFSILFLACDNLVINFSYLLPLTHTFILFDWGEGTAKRSRLTWNHVVKAVLELLRPPPSKCFKINVHHQNYS